MNGFICPHKQKELFPKKQCLSLLPLFSRCDFQHIHRGQHVLPHRQTSKCTADPVLYHAAIKGHDDLTLTRTRFDRAQRRSSNVPRKRFKPFAVIDATHGV